MRLVTFSPQDDDADRIGALIDGDRNIVDLAAAQVIVNGGEAVMFTNMMALIDSGVAGTTAAQILVDAPPSEAVKERTSIRLQSPLPRPRQMVAEEVLEDALPEERGRPLFELHGGRGLLRECL